MLLLFKICNKLSGIPLPEKCPAPEMDIRILFYIPKKANGFRFRNSSAFSIIQ